MSSHDNDGDNPEEEMPPLPRIWDDIDDAIFDARVRQNMSWRRVGEHVGMSFSWARKRFYDRMQRITPAEVEAMRTEENFKLDERETRALQVFTSAMVGSALRHNGRLVTDGNGEPVIERHLTPAIMALREMDRVARSRYKLNGLEAPVVVHFEDVTNPTTQITQELEAYLRGVTDADTGDRAGAETVGSSGVEPS